jgi:hypothetical protein
MTREQLVWILDAFLDRVLDRSKFQNQYAYELYKRHVRGVLEDIIDCWTDGQRYVFDSSFWDRFPRLPVIRGMAGC